MYFKKIDSCLETSVVRKVSCGLRQDDGSCGLSAAPYGSGREGASGSLLLCSAITGGTGLARRPASCPAELEYSGERFYFIFKAKH